MRRRDWENVAVNRNNSGFTLVEMMIVVAILAILASAAIPYYLGALHSAKVTAAKSEMKTMAMQIEMFMISHGRYPLSLEEAELDHIRDPWGKPYEYLPLAVVAGNVANPQGNGNNNGGGGGGNGQARKDKFLVPINSDFDLYSMGPDGRSVSPLTAKHSRDDIIRANNGAFYGIAEQY
ncbi:MAG: general secretion pathway protein G [Planctomycetota bacterium]|jgi:general secretion pathway protein G